MDAADAGGARRQAQTVDYILLFVEMLFGKLQIQELVRRESGATQGRA
jgi:hypothetical protein